MKKAKMFPVILAIALVFVMTALSLTGCPTGSDGGGSGTPVGGGSTETTVVYVSEDDTNIYELTVTSTSPQTMASISAFTTSESVYAYDLSADWSSMASVAYTPRKGDTYVLVIIVKSSGGVTSVSSGTVTTAGGTLKLKPADSTVEITVTISSSTMTKIEGNVGGTVLPGEVTPSADTSGGTEGTQGNLNYRVNDGGATVTITGYNGTPTAVTIPAKISVNGNNKPVTVIALHVFKDCATITSLAFETDSKITRIEWGAFCDCAKLATVTNIPASVTSIWDAAFENCPLLTSVTFAANSKLTSIGGGAFAGCTSLPTVTIPAGVTTIGNSAFARCTSLTSVTIPNSVTWIGVEAFKNCTSLTTVTIPASVTTIAWWAFYGCDNLTTVTFATGSNITIFDDYVFGGGDNLKTAYNTGKAGTYTRASGGSTWTKQP